MAKHAIPIMPIRTRFETQTQDVKGYRLSEPIIINL